MILIQDFDVKKYDAVPVGGEDCGYRGKETSVVEFDVSGRGSMKDELEEGDVGLSGKPGRRHDLLPILRGCEKNLTPLATYVAKLEAIQPCERMGGESEDDRKDLWRKG